MVDWVGNHQMNLFEEELTADSQNYLCLRLIGVGRRLERRVSEYLQEAYDLTLPDWMVLSALLEHAQVSVREIGPLTGYDSVAVSRAVKRLSNAQLVEKKENYRDRRLVVLTPTQAGRELAGRVIEDLEQLEVLLLRKLDVNERIRFGQMLGQVDLPA
ncbi:MarR family winged helix-turn-helix transcriptional regulator [Polycladidibacter hongkongensis]|uniref:MarR family winged helix-turn-helix transcriptional regulator n=1 Tax=Polycladidibacter hongkongensis TaxID=1647556 RepID=UPI000830DEC6|nr:MarR family transcriptional regulator [Pseudovibrio hongkongensis]